MVYAQMPDEVITRQQYLDLSKQTSHFSFLSLAEDAEQERFCTNDTCLV